MLTVQCLFRPYAGEVLRRARGAISTSNLIKHIKKCDPGEQNEVAAYSDVRFRVKLAQWCSNSNRSFTTIADPDLGM